MPDFYYCCGKLCSGSASFSRKHPLACWVASMLMCFATSIVSNLLVGESLVIPLKNHQELLLATAVWYDSSSHTAVIITSVAAWYKNITYWVTDHIPLHVFVWAPRIAYSLRTRNHNKFLIPKTSDLGDQHCIIRSLYKNLYWCDLTNQTYMSIHLSP